MFQNVLFRSLILSFLYVKVLVLSVQNYSIWGARILFLNRRPPWEGGSRQGSSIWSGMRGSAATSPTGEQSWLVDWSLRRRPPWECVTEATPPENRKEQKPGGPGSSYSCMKQQDFLVRDNRQNKNRGAEYTCCSCCFLPHLIICSISCGLESGPKELQKHWHFATTVILGDPRQSPFHRVELR